MAMTQDILSDNQSFPLIILTLIFVSMEIDFIWDVFLDLSIDKASAIRWCNSYL